jgi:hypothetical protein
MAKGIVLPVFRCTRCEHTWYPKKPEKPKRCAKCGSPYWEVPKKVSTLTRAENNRRNELAIDSYERIAGPGSWEQHEMGVTAWQFGGNAPWDDMTDAEIIEWAQDFARIDLDLDQEIARERAEAEED